MFKSRLLHGILLGLLIAGPKSVWSLSVARDPLKAGTDFDVGQMAVGNEKDRITQMIQRTSVFVSQSVTVEERLRLEVELDGLFFYAYPTGDLPHLRLRKFATWIEKAYGVEALGNLQDPWGHLQFGYFSFKYNPDARNLGEYLYRSGAYPNYIMTGGWSIIDHARAPLEGLNLEVYTGPVTHNLLATIESGVEPIHDISGAYFASLKAGEAFTFGAGAAFGHIISSRTEMTTPPGASINDPGNVPINRYKGDSIVTDTGVTGYSNYTFQNTKLMARAAFNPQTWIQTGMLGPEDLKVYTEVALLGVKNYPFYYEHIINRLPVMVGFNVPTFKLLDLLAVEGEYHQAEFEDDISESYGNGLPLPALPRGQTYAQTVATYDKKALKEQYIKWSVYAKKTVMPGLVTYLQVASDHMRGIVFDKTPEYDVITKGPGDWYFLFRIELGI